MTLHFLNGDATRPQGAGMKILVHVCNDAGKWGRGFVLAVSKRWPEPERTYRNAFRARPKPALGDVQFVTVASDIVVANVIGQHGVRSPMNTSAPPPIRYAAIATGLYSVGTYAREHRASVHMPRIGSRLAGGDWHDVEAIVCKTLIANELDVFVYDLKPSKN